MIIFKNSYKCSCLNWVSNLITNLPLSSHIGQVFLSTIYCEVLCFYCGYTPDPCQEPLVTIEDRLEKLIQQNSATTSEWFFCPHTNQFSNSLIPAGYPIIQFNSNHVELAQTHRLRAQSSGLAPLQISVASIRSPGYSTSNKLGGFYNLPLWFQWFSATPTEFRKAL